MPSTTSSSASVHGDFIVILTALIIREAFSGRLISVEPTRNAPF